MKDTFKAMSEKAVARAEERLRQSAGRVKTSKDFNESVSALSKTTGRSPEIIQSLGPQTVSKIVADGEKVFLTVGGATLVTLFGGDLTFHAITGVPYVHEAMIIPALAGLAGSGASTLVQQHEVKSALAQQKPAAKPTA